MFDAFQTTTTDAGLILPPQGIATPTHEGLRWRCATELSKFYADVDWYRNRYGKAWGERLFRQEQTPFEVVTRYGNLLLVGGASLAMDLLIAAGGTAFNNANAYIGVGDSSTAETRGQTDLQAASNKLRVAMDATFPSHTAGTAVKTITGATNASPIVVTSATHGYSNGDFVHISGVAGNTAANGLWVLQNVATNTFELTGSTGNGAYTSGGDVTKFNVAIWQSTFSTSQANWAWNEWGIFNASVSGTMLNRKTGSYGTKTSAASWQFKVGAALA